MQLTQGNEEKKKIRGSNSRLETKVHLQQFKDFQRYRETCSHTSEIGLRSQIVLEYSLLQIIAHK